MTNHIRHFAVCIRNDEYEGSLELRKIYEVLEDSAAAKHDMVRIIDEEGEDYLYPAGWFLAIELPHNVEEAIVELTHS
jgi:primosomal protein N'